MNKMSLFEHFKKTMKNVLPVTTVSSMSLEKTHTFQKLIYLGPNLKITFYPNNQYRIYILKNDKLFIIREKSSCLDHDVICI